MLNMMEHYEIRQIINNEHESNIKYMWGEFSNKDILCMISFALINDTIDMKIDTKNWNKYYNDAFILINTLLRELGREPININDLKNNMLSIAKSYYDSMYAKNINELFIT